LLESRGAVATVFVVGQWLAANHAIGPRLLQGGHELANHTYTHPVLSNLAEAAVATEITRCRDVLEGLVAVPPRWFRPSGTADGVTVPSATIMSEAARAGYATVVGYDVDPRDFEDPPAATISARAIAGLHPGAIVSLHTGHPNTVAALPAILDALAARNLRPVTMSALLA
jgi:peptidoglycan/xylan/chitin deacetylase (PgdA/CDA1 family)